MATDGRPSNACSSTLSAPPQVKDKSQFHFISLTRGFPFDQTEQQRTEILSVCHYEIKMRSMTSNGWVCSE
jgi:hypothetical protein